MCFTPALKRNLFFLLGLVISLALHSAPAVPSAPLATVPVTATGTEPPPVSEPVHAEAHHVEPASSAPAESDPLKPARKGWWQRRVAVD